MTTEPKLRWPLLTHKWALRIKLSCWFCSSVKIFGVWHNITESGPASYGQCTECGSFTRTGHPAQEKVPPYPNLYPINQE